MNNKNDLKMKKLFQIKNHFIDHNNLNEKSGDEILHDYIFRKSNNNNNNSYNKRIVLISPYKIILIKIRKKNIIIMINFAKNYLRRIQIQHNLTYEYI
jgi:hypothetical protein